MDYVATLKSLPRNKDFFVGIDSDGCVFDSMEIKQKECFCPAVIKHFGLQGASKYARQVWEFVNLYSKTRGCNRFLALQQAFRLMHEWSVFQERGLTIGDVPELNAWIAAESKLGNPALEAKVAASGDKVLQKCLAWSLEVNERIADMVFGLGPFPSVEKCLQKLQGQADMIVVSQTPFEALDREWKEHSLDGYVGYIAGQEAGTKTEHLKYAACGKYEADKILMLGDAPGDYRAAESNGVLYYPIIPGDEEASWQRFYDEGIDRFFAGTFAGAYQEQLLAEFNKALPELPPWQV
jgi:phosphoglycolate phosphatase-like HAD superfamily hydrolase